MVILGKEFTLQCFQTMRKCYSSPFSLLLSTNMISQLLMADCCSCSLWYSEERESDQVLLSKLLPGKTYKCTKRYFVF